MAMIIAKLIDHEDHHLVVTCETDPGRKDIALQWETNLGFCFSMERQTAEDLLKQLGELLRAYPKTPAARCVIHAQAKCRKAT